MKLRRLKLRDKAKGKATRAKPPARGTESGLGGVGGGSLAFRSGGVAGRKRKSTAAGAAEAERAEKVIPRAAAGGGGGEGGGGDGGGSDAGLVGHC